MHLRRAHLLERLSAAGSRRVTLIAAPAGFGKSDLLDAYLAGCTKEFVRFDVRRAHGSIARFVRAFAAALEPQLPAIGQSLAIAYERARQAPKASDVLATWLAEHLETPLTIVVDDFHLAEGEFGIAKLLALTIERTRGVRWIVATRSSSDLPLATWLARGDAGLPLDEETLRLNASEARELAAVALPEADARAIERLRQTTGGAVGTFTFALQTIAQEPAIAERLLAGGGGVFERYAEEVLRRLSAEEQRLLLEAAAAPEIDEALSGWAPGDAESLASIGASLPQIFTRRANGSRHLHDLFAAELRRRLSDLGGEAVRAASLRAAVALERAGRVPEALAFHIRDRRDDEIVRLVETYGLNFFGAGRGEAIHEAIDALDPLVQMSSSSVLAIKAISDSMIGRFDTAESWFQLAIDRAAGSLRAELSYQYGTHLLRFFRPEAAGIFEGLLTDPGVPDKLRAYAHAALGPAYVFVRRIEDARATASAGIALAGRLGEPHLLAKSHQQASFVELFAGDALRAKELATAALAISTEHGFYDIASGALSVLYNVASDIDDDPAESVRLLAAMGENGAKSGSLKNHVLSLCSTLEIEVELGNEEAADLLDAKIRELDVTLAGPTIYETLLPSRAMRAAWAADFTGAYRLLASSAEQQWSPDRKALRYAELATYAAAAGRESDASSALQASLEQLAAIDDVDLRVQRTRLFLALAAIVLGRSETATEMLLLVDAAPRALSQRLVALRRVLGALHERYRGARNQADVLAYLDDLSRQGFAGIGRVIGVLPLADYAKLRALALSRPETALVLRWSDGDSSAPARAIEDIARRLGCADTLAVKRAVVWHRGVFERRDSADARHGERRT